MTRIPTTAAAAACLLFAACSAEPKTDPAPDAGAPQQSSANRELTLTYFNVQN